MTDYLWAWGDDDIFAYINPHQVVMVTIDPEVATDTQVRLAGGFIFTLHGKDLDVVVEEWRRALSAPSGAWAGG